MTNSELVLEALRVVFSERRIDQIDRFFSPDFVQHSPYTLPGGREELKQWWAGIVAAIPDVSTEITQVVSNASEVVTFRMVSGTVTGDLPAFGIKGNGQRIEFRCADIFLVKDSQIAAHWEVADTGPLVQIASFK